MEKPIIEVQDLSKRYRLGQLGMTSLREQVEVALHNLMHRQKREIGDFWALRDIDFQLQNGEVLGIIGRNGAGKSTLLKILSRITQPTTGRITLRGRVSSLLEVGTGFHEELTGRENTYLNGTILGMKKREIDKKFEEIVEFAGVEEFIDTPVKRYSSGMTVRLGFAVAAHLEPDILIVDEVLAVGDAEFQKKCIGKMKDVAGHGRTVLFVSHNMDSIRNLCSRCLVLQEGRKIFDGKVSEGLKCYLSRNAGQNTYVKAPDKLDPQKEMEFLTCSLPENCEGDDHLELEYIVRKKVGCVISVCIQDLVGTPIFQTIDTDIDQTRFTKLPGRYKVRLPLPFEWLQKGRYSISLSAADMKSTRFDKIDGAVSFSVVAMNGIKNSFPRSAPVFAPLEWKQQQVSPADRETMNA